MILDICESFKTLKLYHAFIEFLRLFYSNYLIVYVSFSENE